MANIIQINGKKLKDTSAARMSSLAPVESSATASAAHAVGDYFWLNGTLYEATAAIAIGNTITVGTNCEVAYLGAEVSELKTHKMPNITYGDPEVVLAETTLNFTKDGDNDWYYAEIDNFNYAANTNRRSKFIVDLDGVEYGDLYWSSFGHAASNGNVYGSNFIGDGLCIGMQRKNNCPFCVQCYYDGTKLITRITAYNSQASHTVKISVQKYVDVTIAPKEAYYEGDQIQLITFGSGNNAYGIGTYIADLSGNSAFATGSGTIASGSASYAEGTQTTASGNYSHAEGYSSIASGNYSHAEGYSSIASDIACHAEGESTTASGTRSHAEGRLTVASGARAHAEGLRSVASGPNSHAECQDTVASGAVSHAEGGYCVASGTYSHAEGLRTIANHLSQHVFGECNTADPSAAGSDVRGTYVEIVGNGTADNARSNARTLDWSGNESLAGGITLGKGTADEVTLSAAQLKQLLALLN